MEDIDWDEAKNVKLKNERGLGFEDIVLAISERRVLANVPNYSKSYPKQRLLIVEINNYAYVVPYVINNKVMFLKTIYPSRVATKQYLNQH